MRCLKMSDYDKEYEELTTPQKMNERKSRMSEYGLGILPVKSNMGGYGASILLKKNDISRFIPKDRHTTEFVYNGDGSYSQTIVKKPRK
jgi:hypothetical protein